MVITRSWILQSVKFSEFIYFESDGPLSVSAGDMFYSQPAYDDISPTQMTETRLVRVPIAYMPLDHGQKRILSPEIAQNTPDKRIRHQSIGLSSSELVTGPSGPEVFTMADIMAELRKLRVEAITKQDLTAFVTRDELKAFEVKQIAQSEEISQLRVQNETQEARLKQVEEAQSKQTVERAARERRPEATERDVNKQVGFSEESPRWLNVIMHGIRKEENQDLFSTVISIGDSLGMTVYKEDIRDVYRLPNRNPNSARPPHVLVTFDRPYLRNNFLRRKYDLSKVEKYSDVYLNADEPMELRRLKGLYRRIATAARSAGETVVMGQDWIKIGNTTYLPTEIDQIPTVFMPLDFPVTAVTQAAKMDTQEGSTAGRQMTSAGSTSPSIPEKIRLTTAGLIFSGPTAYLSNHARAPFVYDGTPYTSSEQGFHHLGAAHHLEFDVAERILKEDDIAKIRELSHEYPRSPGWERIAPHKLYELNRAKFNQNPHLRARLIATAPHRLIEASIDKKWGGAAPYSSGVYDKGIVPGRNVFGDKLTSLRDELIANDMLTT